MAQLAHEILITENVHPDMIILEVTESALLEPTGSVTLVSVDKSSKVQE